MSNSIRLANEQDLLKLVAIDALSNAHAWQLPQFQAALQSANTQIYVFENKNKVLGFIVWQTVLDETELHLIATLHEYRQQGIGSQLLNTMFQAVAQQQVVRILLEVRQSNLVAQTFYQRHGFTVCGIRKRYYEGLEDALLMEKLC